MYRSCRPARRAIFSLRPPLLPNRTTKANIMKTELLALATGALLSAATLTYAHASPAGDQWLADARAAIEARLTGDAVPDAGRTVVVRLNATGEPRTYNPRIVRSSGSLEYDLATRRALDGLRLRTPPAELRGRPITFTLGEPAAVASAVVP